MKINWFSPVPPTPSSIALDTATVLPILSQRAEIVVWTREPARLAKLDHPAKVRSYRPDSMPWEEINSADITVYHLGNQAEFHGAIWRVNRENPGVVVLHDLNLQHFFSGLVTHTNDLSRREYLQMMGFHHGERGRELGRAVLSGQSSPAEISAECPLTLAAIENALGVAVHTQAGYSQLAQSTDVPLAYVPLFAPPRLAGSTDPARGVRPAAEPYRIIIFGFLGQNRRLPSLLQALQEFPQKDRFHLDIYGRVADEKSVRQIIDSLGLRKLVTLHGFVSDQQLDDALSGSDLAINLRNPTMGEASASQLRIWQHGLPSLVTEIGWYATLPADTVAKVRPEAELEDIQTHLSEFLLSPERYHELGRNGSRYVNEHHTVDAYVDRLMELIQLTIDSRRRAAVRWMSRRAGEFMRPWYSDDAASLLIPTVTDAIHDLCAGQDSSR